MTNEETKAQAEEILQSGIENSAHQSWLNHPVTKQALALIRAHADSHTGAAASNSMNPNVDDASVRRGNVAAYNLLVLYKILSETENFQKGCKQYQIK
jgi:hypothetical protein